MENFPSNSQRPTRPAEEPKRVERIVTSEVRRRKTPRSRRITKTFFGGDPRSTGTFIVTDIIAPMLRDLLFTVVKDGTERIIYQDSSPRPRNGMMRPGGGPTNYAGVLSSRGASQPQHARRGRSSYDIDDLVFNNRAEAMEILDRLEFYLDKYSQVSVADLYGLVGISNTSMDNNWGWTDLSAGHIRHNTDGYVLILPRPESFK